MLEVCRTALTVALQPLGLRKVIYEEKDAGSLKARPYALLLWGDEDLQRARRRAGHTDDTAAGTRIIHQQVARRTIPVQVRLVAETPEQLDQLLTQFLASLPPRIQTADSGPITVVLRGAETPPAEGLLKREARWESTVEFTGSIISNRSVRLFRLATDVALESEVQV